MIFLWGLTFLNEFFMYLDPFFEYGSSFETLLWRIKKQFYISVFLMTIFCINYLRLIAGFGLLHINSDPFGYGSAIPDRQIRLRRYVLGWQRKTEWYQYSTRGGQAPFFHLLRFRYSRKKNLSAITLHIFAKIKGWYYLGNTKRPRGAEARCFFTMC